MFSSCNDTALHSVFVDIENPTCCSDAISFSQTFDYLEVVGFAQATAPECCPSSGRVPFFAAPTLKQGDFVSPVYCYRRTVAFGFCIPRFGSIPTGRTFLHKRFMKAQEAGHPLMAKVPHQGGSLTIEMNSDEARTVVFPCPYPAKCLVQLLGSRSGFKERLVSTRSKKLMGLPMVLFEGPSLLSIQFFLTMP